MSSHRNDERRVVVTGLGVVSSLGIGWQEFWKNLIAGKSGISKVSSFDTSDYDRHYGGEVKNFDPSQFISKHRINKLGRTTQMAVAAAKLALRDADINLKEIKNTAISIGTTGGERKLLEMCNAARHEHRAGRNKILFDQELVACATDNLALRVGEELSLNSHCTTISTACAAGNYAIGEGFDLIRHGLFDCAIVGGADSFSKMIYAGFSRLYDIAPEECQPFDVSRQGTIPGEGSGVLVLETLVGAKSRNARIYAEILGYGLSCDAHHMTNPSVTGIIAAIQKAIKDSRIQINDVDYISAHGTATRENDHAECNAIHAIFDTRKILISSIKSMLGHAMGAASAIAAIACCKVVHEDIAPPTINFHTADPSCDIDCTPNYSRKVTVKVAINNGFGFGGNNSTVVIKKLVDNAIAKF